VLERLALHVLHHDEEHIVLLLSREYGDDVGMAHRREEPWLLHELAEVEILLVRDLEGDFLVDPGVFSEVNRAETATPKRREDAVLTNQLTTKEHRG
jgi:hypothetical protein